MEFSGKARLWKSSSTSKKGLAPKPYEPPYQKALSGKLGRTNAQRNGSALRCLRKDCADFTDKSKEELLSFLLCSTTSPCVRMLASQEKFTPEEVQLTAQKIICSGKVIPAAALALVMLLAAGCYRTPDASIETPNAKDSNELPASLKPHYLQKLDVPPPIRPVMGFTAPAFTPPREVMGDIEIKKTGSPEPVVVAPPPEPPVLLGEPAIMGAPPMPPLGNPEKENAPTPPSVPSKK